MRAQAQTMLVSGRLRRKPALSRCQRSRRQCPSADAILNDVAGALHEALRKPAAGEKQVQELCLRLECDAKGIMFVVQLAARVIRLRTSKFEKHPDHSVYADAGSEIACGPRKPGNHVVICYVPTTDPKARYDGDLRSVEFVPSDFKLEVK